MMQSEASSSSQPFFVEAPLSARGALVWVTGLAATGKSRLAARLSARLATSRRVEVLAGDEVRRHLSERPDGSREASAIVAARLGFVARLLARHGVIVIAPEVAFDEGTRAELRAAATADELPFVEVFMEADLDGLIEAAAGRAPRSSGGHVPQVTVRADWQSVDESVERIVGALVHAGVLEPASAAVRR